MTPEQLGILQHSLGLDEYGRGQERRNHFVTGEGSTDHPVCMSLVECGFMTRRASIPLYGGDDAFFVTDIGRRAVRDESPVPPKVSRSKQRYAAYLAADTDRPFGEWLKTKWARCI